MTGTFHMRFYYGRGAYYYKSTTDWPATEWIGTKWPAMKWPATEWPAQKYPTTGSTTDSE